MPSADRRRSPGAKAWKAWREDNPGSIISKPHWYSSPGRGGRQIKGRNRVDFSGAALSGVTILNAFAEGIRLHDTVIENTIFEEGDFSRADFSGAQFRNTRFNKTILTGANFDGATFVNCNLNRVNLVGASFCVREITETVVYGIAAWDLTTSAEMKQSKLVIEKTYEFYSDLVAAGKIPLMVDDIELAQFVYYLSNHRRIRDTLNILNARGVLVLGGFRNGGLERLNAIRERLARHGYMAMVFDFARPDSLSLTETVVTMAGLSKFVVVDVTGPSIPHELQAIFGQLKKPMLAIGNPYAMFPDLADQTALVTIDSDDQIDGKLDELERLHAQRTVALARRYEESTRRVAGAEGSGPSGRA